MRHKDWRRNEPLLLVLRQPVWARALSALALGGCAVLLAVAGVDAGSPLTFLGPLSGAAMIACAVRTWRLAAIATPSALTFRNQWRTHTFAWEETDRVLPGRDEVVLRLRDGREVTLSAFSLPPGALRRVARRNRTAARRLQVVVAGRRQP